MYLYIVLITYVKFPKDIVLTKLQLIAITTQAH